MKSVEGMCLWSKPKKVRVKEHVIVLVVPKRFIETIMYLYVGTDVIGRASVSINQSINHSIFRVA